LRKCFPSIQKKIAILYAITIGRIFGTTVIKLLRVLNFNYMISFLNLIAFLLFVTWLGGVILFKATGLFHLLLILSLIAILLRVVRGAGAE